MTSGNYGGLGFDNLGYSAGAVFRGGGYSQAMELAFSLRV